MRYISKDQNGETMVYKIEGYANRLIVDENGTLVATYVQLPKGQASEIMLKSGSIKKENRAVFLKHLLSLVDNKSMTHCSTTNKFFISDEISGGGYNLHQNKYPTKLVKFLNKQND